MSVSDTEPCGSCVAPSMKTEDRTGCLNTPSNHSHPSPASSPYTYLAKRSRNTYTHRLSRPSGNVQWARSDKTGEAICLTDASRWIVDRVDRKPYRQSSLLTRLHPILLNFNSLIRRELFGGRGLSALTGSDFRLYNSLPW